MKYKEEISSLFVWVPLIQDWIKMKVKNSNFLLFLHTVTFEYPCNIQQAIAVASSATTFEMIVSDLNGSQLAKMKKSIPDMSLP